MFTWTTFVGIYYWQSLVSNHLLRIFNLPQRQLQCNYKIYKNLGTLFIPIAFVHIEFEEIDKEKSMYDLMNL